MSDSVDLATKKVLLRKQACFAQLTEPEIEMLASLLSEKHCNPGDTIVSQGDRVDSIFIIVSGTADVRTYQEDGTMQTSSVATMQPGQAIGLNETGFYSLTGKRTATVIAETEMVLLRLSVAALHGFALAYSHVNKVMKETSKQILGTGKIPDDF